MFLLNARTSHCVALQAEIIQDPARYVELDPQTAQALLDQKQAGKQLLLITNSGGLPAAILLAGWHQGWHATSLHC